MKNLFLTLALAVLSIAAFAQTPLTVVNDYAFPIIVRGGVITTATCLPAGFTTPVIIPSGGFAVLNAPVPGLGNSWYGLRVSSIPGFGPTASLSTTNKCLFNCLTPLDASNGLNAEWDAGSNCETVKIF